MKIHKPGLDAVSLAILILGLVPGVLAQTDDNAKVIAATVFITVIAIAILAVIVWCILKRYLKVKSMRTTPRRQAQDNPAFAELNEGTYAEEGSSQYIKSDNSPVKTLSSYNGPNSLNKKDWISLPKMQYAGPEYGSYGSLNSFVGLQDPDIVSVDLLGQDFTGLGFNISGNMRDGIFIDEIRNRGPAKESEKLKPGDLIKEVSISFKNIVFKDALAILGYASPYPVKVTVEKQKATPLRSSLSSKGQILHPLYHSQSLNALNGILKEPAPKISYNDLKGRRKSPGSSAKQNLSIDQIRRSTDSSVFDPEYVTESSEETLKVIIHSEKPKVDEANEEKKILPEKDRLVNSQNPQYSLTSQVGGSIDGSLKSKEDISNIDEKMDLQFSKYDKEFLDLKHEAEEKSSRLKLDMPDNERKRSLNSESEFAEIERGIRYSAHFSELYDKINDKSSIPRFNPEKLSSDRTAIEDTISVTTSQTAMSQNPNIRDHVPKKDITNGIVANELSVGNDFTPAKPFSLNSKSVFKDKPSLTELETEIVLTEKDFSYKSPFKNSPEIPSFDGNFTDLNEIQEPKIDTTLSKSSTENLFTMPLKFVRKDDDLENSFSKYLAGRDSSDTEIINIPNHNESTTLQLDSPDISTRVEVTKDLDVTNLPSEDFQNKVDLQLTSDELETNANDSIVTKAKGLLSTDDFKNKILDRSYDLRNNVDTSFDFPMLSDDDFNVQLFRKQPEDEASRSSPLNDVKFTPISIRNDNKNKLVNDAGEEFGKKTESKNTMLTTNGIGFLCLSDSNSLISETDDSDSPKLAVKKFQTSAESQNCSDNDSINIDSALKIPNHDMEIETDTKITLEESSNSNINSFFKEDLNLNSKSHILETSTEPSNIKDNFPNSSESEEEKSRGGFFSKAMKKVRSVLKTDSPANESNKNHSDISFDSSQENNPDLSDRNISPRDIHISTDSDEEHNKKDEAFFEMTEDEQSTDTQSLSPKSMLTNPISFNISSGNNKLLTTPLEIHKDKTLNHLDGENHQDDASSSQIVETSHIVTPWSEMNEDKLKVTSDNHLKFNGKDLSPTSEKLTRPSFFDSNFSVSSDETKTNSTDKFETISTPAMFEPRSITISHSTSHHYSHGTDNVTSTDSSCDSHDTSSFDTF